VRLVTAHKVTKRHGNTALQGKAGYHKRGVIACLKQLKACQAGHTMRVILILIAAHAAQLAAKAPDSGIVSIPRSAGALVELGATVRYVSDGYFVKNCAVVVSSGDPIADEQACKTISHRRSRKPIEAVTSVWKKPNIEGQFVEPLPRNLSTWLTFEDYSGYGQGTAVMQMDIDASGKLSDCKVIKSSGAQAIDRIAKSTICKRAKFYPASLNGQPVAATLLTAARFYVGD
jgi:TonB family protein